MPTVSLRKNRALGSSRSQPTTSSMPSCCFPLVSSLSFVFAIRAL
jgi:hypothetical protein